MRGLFYYFFGSREINYLFYEEKREYKREFGPLFGFLKGENMGKLESEFQGKLIKEIKSTFDGAIVTKLDANYIQGIPDLLVLHRDKWATLECKKDARAKKQPNQEYYVGKMNEMSFSRFICPENKEAVLNELKVYFQ